MIASLQIEGLTISRGARRLFSDLSLTVGAGEAIMLSGANGAGKTSLIRAVAGLLPPDAGKIHFRDALGDEIELDDARAGQLHLAGHHDGLKNQRTAAEELDFWTAWLGGPPTGRALAVETYELAPLLALEVRRLSAGQRRRLALARLKAAPRALWLLDEPLAPLDARWRTTFGAEMKAHLDRGGLILAAAHDPLPVPCRILDVGA